MDDTRPEMTEKIREMFQKKTPIERLKMGFSMHETSKYLISRAIREQMPIYSGAELRQQLFLSFYGNDFDPTLRQRILEHFKSFSTPPLEVDDRFQHIPDEEKAMKWWKLLSPIVKARLSRENRERSHLLSLLNKKEGLYTWRNIKKINEMALNQVKNGEQIFSRTSELKSSPEPDGVIDDLFAELRTIPYLLFKGFKNISYARRNDLDFRAEFEGKEFRIESTYVHGPDFKTQEWLYPAQGAPFFKIKADKLIQLFRRTYSNKEDQVIRNKGNEDNTLIVMITDLEECYEPWLEHEKIEECHPLLKLILDWKIPTVIFGPGSVYEPPLSALKGTFGKLQLFNWESFVSEYLSVGNRC